MESIELQKIFFQHIKSKLANHVSFVEDIADLLDISTDSSYRRIRGEKPITFDEIQKLCRHYQVSLDHILSINSNSTVFFGSWVDVENFDFEHYLSDMLNQLNFINKSETKIMYYEAKDIPPFHHFQFPELAAFKYFFWMKTILSYREYSKMQFEDNDIMGLLHEPGLELISTYNEVPSVEIWGVESVNATLRQIDYYKQAGVFKKRETIEHLFEQLQTLIEHIKDQAECGEKYLIVEEPTGKKDNYQLYFNEIFLGHNSILVETDGNQAAYINYGVLNYITTFDPVFCNYTKKSFENTIKKSLLISSVSEKERNRFFNMLRENISIARKNILS